MLANNRRPNEAALATYEINSINTNKGTKAKGQPAGIKYEKNFNLCIESPSIVTPAQIVKEKPRHIIADVVIVKL